MQAVITEFWSQYGKAVSLMLMVVACQQMGRLLFSPMPNNKKLALFSLYMLALAFSINQGLYLPLDLQEVDLQGKTYLVTGCTPGGIGHSTARTLAEWNAKRVICTVRSEAKGRELGLPANVEYQVVELADFDSVREFAKQFEYKLDGLILNAGLGTDNMQVTKNGYEEMFQVNHLSQFLMVHLLAESNKLKPTSRTVFVSSTAHLFMSLLDRKAYSQAPGRRMQATGEKNTMGTYSDTKLMNVLTAKALASKFKQSGVFVSTCPGFVATNFQSHMPDDLEGKAIKALIGLARTPEEGAARIIQLATKPVEQLKNGKFYDAYIPLPASSQITQDNIEWLYQTSLFMVKDWLLQ